MKFTKSSLILRAGHWEGMAIALLFLLSLVPVKAQNTLRAQTNVKLNMHIHLPPGKTTLAVVMDALSKQVGMKIEAVEFLQERRVALALGAMTARDVLNGLAELNNWRWYETETGSILLTAQRPVLPEHLLDLPHALQTALTKDFNRYLGIGVPLDDLAADNETLESEQKTRLALGPSQDKHRAEMMDRMLANSRIHSKIYNLTWKSDRQLGLLHSLQPGIMDGREVPVTSLSASQQETLRRALAAWALLSFNEEGADRLFNAYLQPFEIDPSVTVLQLEKNGTLSLGSNDAHGIFITGIMAHVPLPPATGSH